MALVLTVCLTGYCAIVRRREFVRGWLLQSTVSEGHEKRFHGVLTMVGGAEEDG